MIYTLEQILAAQKGLENVLPGDVQICIDILVGSSIADIVAKDELSHDEFQLVNFALLNQPCMIDKDISSLVTRMSITARERSSGAVMLKKVFISNNTYHKLAETIAGTDHTFKITVGKIPLIKLDGISDGRIIGLCSPKFNYIPSSLLVIQGLLKE